MLIRAFLAWLAAWLVVLPMNAEAQSLLEAAERGDLPGVERLIAAGVPFEDLGELTDPITLTPGLLPVAEIDGDTVRAEVWWIDRFGNAQLNVGPEVLTERGIELGDPIELTIRDRGGMVRWVHTYADAKSSELVLVVDSYGLLSIALDRRSAAAEHDLRIGTEVRIAPPPPIEKPSRWARSTPAWSSRAKTSRAMATRS